MFNLRRVFALWAFAAWFLGSAGWAQAQGLGGASGTGSVSVTLGPIVTRDHQSRSGTIPVTQVNYNDCLTEDFANFSLTFGTGYNNYFFEVWSGDGCDNRDRRLGSATVAPVCWQVGGGQPNNIVYTLSVKVRDMLAGRTVGGDAPVAPDTGSAGAGGADGSDGSTDPNVPTGAPGACVATTPATAPQTLTLYFMLVDGGKNSVGMATWKLTYKLTSAPPPDHVQADVGENIAPISWSYDSNQSDPYTAGYQFFCDPGPGQSGLDEAGIMPEPGIIPICQHSVILQPGTRPEDKYKCGTAERTATKGNATGLFNNVAYNVAVATTDTYLNVGNISEPTCAVPQPVTGFFEAYRGAGGLGGGGFCSFSRRGDPAVLLAVLGLGSCLLLRRRRAT